MAKRKTTEQAIADFCKVHGNRYDYSRVDYKNNLTKVIIVCPVHGEFEQRPHQHTAGEGCLKCANKSKAKSCSETVLDFQKVHGNRYDYSKVNYKNSHSNVTIVCREHGDFKQSPSNHKRGNNCPSCVKNEMYLSTETLIKQFRTAHADFYDYSEVIYEGGRSKITIVCPIHGYFEQTPDSHKIGHGCPACILPTTEKIVNSFREIHGDRYDYSKVDYINCDDKLVIVCREHGDFEQLLNSHKKGFGCRKCSGNHRYTNQEIVEQFKQIHGDRYDYSKVNYKNNQSKVTIICPEHGEFEQASINHKRGNNCPECAKGLISEPIFREVLERVMSRFGPFLFPNVRPEWLKNPETNRNLELDCYNRDLQVAFELQGIQHYEPRSYFGGEKTFIKIIRRDNHKLIGCRKRRVQLFRIDNRPASGKPPQIKRQYYENEIKKCLTKLPEDVKLKLLNANNKEIKHGNQKGTGQGS